MSLQDRRRQIKKQRRKRKFYRFMQTLFTAEGFAGIIVMAGAEGLKEIPMEPMSKMIFFLMLGLTMLISGGIGCWMFEQKEQELIRKEKRARERQLQTGA